jgi:hypothetical protein
MLLNDLTPEILDAASSALGDEPVTMVNLLWFNDEPRYDPGFQGASPSARQAYYEGYVGAFQAVSNALGIKSEPLYVGSRTHSLLAGPGEDWDDIVIVRYRNFGDLRRIIESPDYARTATPHRLAAVANWRFFATKSLL